MATYRPDPGPLAGEKVSLDMTKKHFIALADTLRALGVHEPAAWQDPYENGRSYMFEEVRDALADFCASQNRHFKRDRWLAYIAGECGPNGGGLRRGK